MSMWTGADFHPNTEANGGNTNLPLLLQLLRLGGQGHGAHRAVLFALHEVARDLKRASAQTREDQRISRAEDGMPRCTQLRRKNALRGSSIMLEAMAKTSEDATPVADCLTLVAGTCLYKGCHMFGLALCEAQRKEVHPSTLHKEL